MPAVLGMNDDQEPGVGDDEDVFVVSVGFGMRGAKNTGQLRFRTDA